MAIRKIFLGVAVLGLLIAACDLGKTLTQAGARKVMVATLLSTPAVTVKPEMIAGLDASIPLPDGGSFVLDGGLAALDAGYTIAPQTIAVTFFGQRVGDDLTKAPEGIAGATVTLQQIGGAALALKETGGGTYQLSTLDDAGIQYVENADYTFSAASAGETFVGKVQKVPAKEGIAALHPAAGYIDHAANTDLACIRPDPPTGEELNLGLITVFPIGSDGKQGSAPSYSNVPTTPLEFLKLVVSPSDWKQKHVTIPGSAFPTAAKNYVIIFQTAKLGGADSENLFVGSAIIAGTADVAIVKTH